MKTALKLAPIVLASLACVATPAFAKDHGYDRGDWQQHRGHGDGNDQGDRRGHDRGDDRRGDDRRWSGDRDDDRNDDRNRRYHGNGHWDNGRRGPPPWARGHSYRSYGYNNVYVVPYNDYRRYQLYNPQSGYGWMRDDGGHYMLVQMASGIISDILYRNGL